MRGKLIVLNIFITISDQLISSYNFMLTINKLKFNKIIFYLLFLIYFEAFKEVMQ